MIQGEITDILYFMLSDIGKIVVSQGLPIWAHYTIIFIKSITKKYVWFNIAKNHGEFKAYSRPEIVRFSGKAKALETPVYSGIIKVCVYKPRAIF